MEKISNSTWEQAYGEVPAGFACRVKETVQKMENGGIRIKRRFLPILAFVVLMLAVSALALNGFGLLQTLTGRLRTFLQPDAYTLVQHTVTQSGGMLSSATFTVEEVIYDGRQVYALIRVHANDPAKILLMDSNAEPSWGMDWWKHFNTEEGQTFSNKAFESNRDILQVNISSSLESLPYMEINATEITYDGEDILYTLSLSADGSRDAAPELFISAYNVYREDLPHDQRLETGTLKFNVTLTDVRTVFRADTPIDLPLAGLTVESIALEQTPIATYLTTQYRLKESATDKQIINMQDGIWINWLDESGKPYPEGNSQSGLTPIGEGGMELVTAYRAFETVPKSIALEFYNGMTKERFDTLNIPLTKQGGTNE